MTDKHVLKFLILEDNEADYDLLVRALGALDAPLHVRRVETEGEFRAALTEPLDVILADFALRSFDALAALRILNGQGISVPLILVSGFVSEATAADVLAAGAKAYISKNNLNDLLPVVLRVLDEHSATTYGK